jgi:3-phenylpropionate/trans-cinnamate dioxygenase ferredoxin reductase subunit
MSHVVVIGAGQAGSSLVVKLRTLGYDGDITLIGAETAPLSTPTAIQEVSAG